MKCYPGYKESGVEALGTVPESWEVYPLKRFAFLNYGDALASDVRDIDGGVAVYGSNGPVGWHSKGNAVGPAILVGRKGSYGALNWSEEDCFAIDTVYFVDGSATSSDIRWLYWAMHMGNFDAISQDTGVPGLSRSDAHDTRFPVPPLSEQRAIADFLDRETAKIDAVVEEQRRLIALLAEKRQAVISHAVTRGLNPDAPLKPSGIDWLGDIPEEWEVLRLKADLNFLTSGSRGWAEYYSDDGALFLRIGNLTRDRIDLDLADVQRVKVPEGTEGERTRVRQRDLLFSITAFLGSVAVVPDDMEEAYVSQHVALARLRQELLLPEWVAYATLSSVGNNYLASQGYGGTKIQLSLSDIGNLVVPAPASLNNRQ